MTCKDVAILANQSISCNHQVRCVEGCRCDRGFVLDQDNNICVPISDCPCLAKDGRKYEVDILSCRLLLFPFFRTLMNFKSQPESVFFDHDAVGNEFCVCKNAQFDCRPAKPQEIEALARKEKLKCDQAKKLVATDCLQLPMTTCQVRKNVLILCCQHVLLRCRFRILEKSQ